MNKFKKLSVFALTLLISLYAMASVVVTVNGTTYTIPQTNERGWGTAVTSWIQGISTNTLQPVGGSFVLTADTDFGPNFGIKPTYIKSRSANISATGILRLAKTDVLGWRNNANLADLSLGIDTSDNLTFNGVIIPTATSASFKDNGFSIVNNADATKKVQPSVGGTTGTTTTLTFAPTLSRNITFPDATDTLVGKATTDVLTNKTLTSPVISSISNIGVLTLPTSTDTLVGRATTDTLTNKTLTSPIISSISNTGVLTLPTSTDTLVGRATTDTLTNKSIDATTNTVSNIADANVKAAAGIARNKLAAIGASKAMVTDASGFDSASSVTATELGYLSGVTSSIQTQINSALTNPMTTGGDIIYGGTSGVPTRLANGTSGQYLKSNGTTLAPSWATFTQPTFQVFLSGSGTYTTPANVKWIRVKMVGGGAAGGSGTGGGAITGAGDTTFGTLTAGKGVNNVGGTATGNGNGIAVNGGYGQASYNGGAPNVTGGHGGSSALGGGGTGGANSSGTSGVANTGGGGGGAAWQAGSGQPGYGGGSGAYIDTVITSPSATYSYGVGAGGLKGTANSDGFQGGDGGSGQIVVEEHYF